MSADPDAQRLRSFGHRCVLMADRLEKYRKALQEIAALTEPYNDAGCAIAVPGGKMVNKCGLAIELAQEALQEDKP